MASFKTYTSGLTIKQPLPGTTNFFSTMDADTYQKISEHDHTGGGKGVQISASAIAANAINGTGFRLVNNTWLRSRNADGSGDLNLVSASSANELRFANAGANTRADLGLTIGTNVQAYDADLTTLGAGGSSARTFLGLGTGDSPTFLGITATNGAIGNLTATLLTATNTINFSGLTASRSLALDGSKNVISGQDLSTGGSPTFTGLTLTNGAIANLTATNIAAFTANGNISFAANKSIVEDGTTVTSAGTNQATATVLGHILNYINSAASGTGVLLDSNIPIYGRTYVYVDAAVVAASVNVYPHVGGKIAAGSTNDPLSVAPSYLVEFIRMSSTLWVFNGPATP